jgi:ADP-ribosylglycohydrolase
MVSDDTEHARFTAQALIRSQGDPKRFEQTLAWSFRWWLLGLPAGIGFATLRSIIRLWFGIPPARSGAHSAGNGPAMRSPVLGVTFGKSPARLNEYVYRSTRMTHNDLKAFLGALTAAVAAHVSASGREIDPKEFPTILAAYMDYDGTEECLRLVNEACISAGRGETTVTFTERIRGRIWDRQGVSGYIYHTVPCVIQTWLRHQRDYAGGIREIVEAGGDTDTTAAILGGIIGAGVGKEGIPADWLRGIIEWPRSMAWMERLGRELAKATAGDVQARSPRYLVPGLAVRNAVFMSVVLLHGLRRLLPPY